MRRLGFLLIPMCLLVLGCNEPTETVPTIAPTSGTTVDDHDHGDHDHGDHDHGDGEAAPAEGDSASTGSAVRFVADKSLNVPGMMCPYSCYPSVKETLVALPGVEAVQLAEQPEGTPEGTIANKVVELKVTEGFDLNAALAALKNANFDAESVN